jgi:uncharacterized membrane protein YccC
MANTLKNKLHISINNHNTIIHIIKFTLAFLIGWAVTYLFPQSRSQWIMISIAVVMGSSSVIGLQMNKALLRAAGTLLGGSLGLITFLSPGNSMLFFIMLCFTASFFAWFSRKFEKKNYVASLGMITFLIITYNSNHSLSIAGLRVLDTLIGISISLIISRFIFPVTSKNAIHRLTQNIADAISTFTVAIFIERQERRNNPKFLKIDSQITEAMLKQRNIIDAILFSSGDNEQLKQCTMTLLRFGRAIYHYILFIDTALWENRIEQAGHAEHMQAAIQPFMQKLSDILLQHDIHETQLESTCHSLEEEITYFTTHLRTTEFNDKEQERQHAIQFALRRLVFCIRTVITANNALLKLD